MSSPQKPTPTPTPSRTRRLSTHHSSQSTSTISSIRRSLLHPSARSSESAIASSSASSSAEEDPSVPAPRVKVQTQKETQQQQTLKPLSLSTGSSTALEAGPAPSSMSISQRRRDKAPESVKLTSNGSANGSAGLGRASVGSGVGKRGEPGLQSPVGAGFRVGSKSRPASLASRSSLLRARKPRPSQLQSKSWFPSWASPWSWSWSWKKSILPAYSTTKKSDGPPPPEVEVVLSPRSSDTAPAPPEDLLVKITYACKHILPQRVTHNPSGSSGKEHAYRSPNATKFPWPPSPWPKERRDAVYADAKKDQLKIILATSKRNCPNCLEQSRRLSDAFDLLIGLFVLLGTMVFLIPFQYPGTGNGGLSPFSGDLGWFPLHPVWRNPLDHFYMPWSLGGWNGEWDQYGYYGYLFGDYGPPSKEGQFELHRYGVKQPRLGQMWGPADDDPYEKWNRLKAIMKESGNR